MEENKEIKQENTEKLSYEQLENIAHQLSNQVRQLHEKLQEMNNINLFKRLDYLFKVVENKQSFNSDFVISCTSEIEELITIPTNTDEEDK